MRKLSEITKGLGPRTLCCHEFYNHCLCEIAILNPTHGWVLPKVEKKKEFTENKIEEIPKKKPKLSMFGR